MSSSKALLTSFNKRDLSKILFALCAMVEFSFGCVM